MMHIRFCSVLLTAAFITSTADAQPVQHSVVHDSETLSSEILMGPRRYAVYLPPGYFTSNRSYPVLYLLHGAGDDQTGWVQFGEVQHYADAAIAEGAATPMVIVMPDANTGRRGYFNDVRGDWNYEDFFFDELVPHIEANYRVKSEKRYRAIAGLSMGGGGAFLYALHRPDLFSAACPLSASTGSRDVESFRRRLERAEKQDDTAALDIDDRTLESYVRRHSVVHLMETAPAEEIQSVRWYIDCGDDDFLYEGNSLVHIAMRKRNLPHEFRIRDGGHRWSYWRSALPEVLKFVTESFHQN